METPVASTPPIAGSKTNVLSILSLVTGILGLIGMCLGISPLGWFCTGIGALLGVAALVLGIISTNQIKKSSEKGKGMALAGRILGALTLLGVFISIAFVVLLGPIIGNVYSQINSTLTP